jgi:hypothetical protein
MSASALLVAAVRAAVDDPAFAVGDVHYRADLFRVTDTALAKNKVAETTGVVVVVGPRRLFGVSTGDSEAWVVYLPRRPAACLISATERPRGSRRPN